MTAQIIAAELGNLIQDSKRKNTELRNAAEKALQDLKSLPNTSEAQLSADLSRRPLFISPFLIACGTHSAKFASTGVSCLQRLGVSRALPRERLPEVLKALSESVALSHDVQLKILQALPSLLQNYAVEIRGELLSALLQICSGLQNAKNFAVSNTAAATLQQLVITVFDRVASEDAQALEIPTVASVKCDNDIIPVRPAAHDAYRMFNDLILLVMGDKPVFMQFSSIPPAPTLELIEAVLFNHDEAINAHPELIYPLRTLLMPLIIRSLSDRLSFPVTVRVFRILNLIIRNHLETLLSECEIALGLLNHMLEPEASQLWKRALSLEIFRGIYADPRLILAIYLHFDAQEGKKDVFGTNLAAFVRLAVERPALIGLGQQSTVPASLDTGKNVMSDQAVAEAGALAGVIGGPVTDNSSGNRSFGISTQWSSMKTACLEHLDKSDPPALPETYVYSLVLTCITNISESLAKFVLPLTVHHESKSRRRTKAEDIVEQDLENHPSGLKRQLSRTQSFRKKTIPVNPLDLTDHPAYPYVQTSSTLVTNCWPAVLATCSTFLNAALDTDYYRALVRAIQKFTQVAGLLRQATPRDAFLTTLGKAAVPSNLVLASASPSKSATGDKSGVFSNAKALLSVDSIVSQASTLSIEKNRRPSHEVTVAALGPRNLLCLRALLNLAIALGPTLHSAWSIVFETLQVADLVMALSSHNVARTPGLPTSRTDLENTSDKLEAETAAVQAAARRLFESTVDYPNESFLEVLQALCSLLNIHPTSDSGQRTPTMAGHPQLLHQRRLGSVSGISLNTENTSRDSAFALNKIGELTALNESRMAQYEPTESGWDIFIAETVRYATNDHNATPTRLLAADILSRTIREIAELSMSDDQREEIQARILAALQKEISALYHNFGDDDDMFSDASKRVHQIALEALKSVIEQCGDSLVAGWNSVLGSLMSVFMLKDNTESIKDGTSNSTTLRHHRKLPTAEVVSRALARSAFATINLICSDFLAAVPDACLLTLLSLLDKFCCQQEDFNMSLTAITYFWNVSDFLQSRSDASALSSLLKDVQEPSEFRQTVLSSAYKGSVPALWLRVLLSLLSVTTDDRTEVRNSAIQTIQRIFENYAEQISSDVWLLCLRMVLFGVVEANLAVQQDARSTSRKAEELEDLNETTKTILQTVSVLFTTYIGKLDSNQLNDAWSALLDYLQQYFTCGSHVLGASVFRTFSEVLSHIDSSHALGTSLLKTASAWRSYFDSSNVQQTKQEGNQDAFVAYAEAFKAIYQLADDTLVEDLPPMLSNLESCIIDSDEVAYSSDLDNMTDLQSRVLECLSIVRTKGSEELSSHVIQLLSRFVLLPYVSTGENPGRRGPTFVALSKASMTLLQEVVIRHIEQDDIYHNNTFSLALQSLAKPLKEKYTWQREGKPPTLWQKATTTTIAILQPALQHVDGHATKEIWVDLVDTAHYITRAQMTTLKISQLALENDELFDIQAFSQLRDLITLPLGSSLLSDQLRRSYSRNLFSVSLIHMPLPGELPDVAAAPLEELYKIRLGQTADLEPIRRLEMSYACLSELIKLVAVQDSSLERVKLAQAAAPYFILRTALPLKIYIADHPLRGRMPAPESQRRELLFVLTKLEKLKIEPQAIPDVPGVRSKYRKHLHRLYPLLIKALKLARNDVEVLDKLVSLIDLVGREFGLDRQ